MRKAVLSLFIIFIIGLLVPGCSETEDYQEHKEVTVSLKLAGDFQVDVSQEPITKASSDDLYAVNVFRGNSPYASGLFDDVSTMNVTLLSGYKYTFTCCLIKNGKSMLYYGKAFGSEEEEGYAYPFQRGTGNNIKPTSIENQFSYSSTLSGIKNGLVHTKGCTGTTLYGAINEATTSNAILYAPINRYYGETRNYTPIQNGVVEIELKRVCFGVQFEVSGLEDGYLAIGYGIYKRDDQVIGKSIYGNGLTDISILSFADPYDCWNFERLHPEENPYSISSEFSITYVNSERDPYLDIWNKNTKITVTLKRNVVTKIKITVNPDLSGIIGTYTEEPFSDENSINIEVQGGGFN